MGNVLAFCEFHGGALRSSALANLTFARQAAQRARRRRRSRSSSAPARSRRRRRRGEVRAEGRRRRGRRRSRTTSPRPTRRSSRSSRRSKGATVVSATATSLGKDLMPRVAALLDAGMASDIAKLESARTRSCARSSPATRTRRSRSRRRSSCVTPRQSEFEPAAELAAPRARSPRAPAGAVERARRRRSSASTRRRAIAPISATRRSSSRAAAA